VREGDYHHARLARPDEVHAWAQIATIEPELSGEFGTADGLGRCKRRTHEGPQPMRKRRLDARAARAFRRGKASACAARSICFSRAIAIVAVRETILAELWQREGHAEAALAKLTADAAARFR